jgi:hypothetical protein
MTVFEFMVDALTGKRQTLPTVGTLVCVARNGKGRWIRARVRARPNL